MFVFFLKKNLYDDFVVMEKSRIFANPNRGKRSYKILGN